MDGWVGRQTLSESVGHRYAHLSLVKRSIIPEGVFAGNRVELQ